MTPAGVLNPRREERAQTHQRTRQSPAGEKRAVTLRQTPSDVSPRRTSPSPSPPACQRNRGRTDIKTPLGGPPMSSQGRAAAFQSREKMSVAQRAADIECPTTFSSETVL